MLEKVKSNLVLNIEQEIENTLNKLNYALIDINVIGGKNKRVSIFVYKDKLSVEELSKLNHILYPVLENISFLKDGFALEISTPGIFREIKYKKEFNIFKDKEVVIVLNDGKTITGIINCLDNDSLSLIIDKKNKNLDIQEIKSAKLNG